MNVYCFIFLSQHPPTNDRTKIENRLLGEPDLNSELKYNACSVDLGTKFNPNHSSDLNLNQRGLLNWFQYKSKRFHSPDLNSNPTGPTK